MFVSWLTTPSRCAFHIPPSSSCLPIDRLDSVFLPAADIPSFVGKGNVDLGITGHDVILEAAMQNHVSEALKLEFGQCALQVQVPESGSIQTVEDLAGKRIVTSFEVLAKEYFGKLDDRLQLSGENRTQIEYVGGSVETACALGLADGIGKAAPPLARSRHLSLIE
jgi:ATP phosphoribosyltransferase